MKIKCPLCNSTKVKAKKVTVFGTVMECTNCETVFTEPEASTKIERLR